MLSAITTNPAPGQQERIPRAGAVNTKLKKCRYSSASPATACQKRNYCFSKN
jgi:hypothetical protein